MGFFFAVCVGGVIIGVIGVWGRELLCVVDVLAGGRGAGQRTGPLSEELLLTPDLAG